MHGIFLTDFDNLYEELNSLYEAEATLTPEEQTIYNDAEAQLPDTLNSVDFRPLGVPENADAGIYVVKHNIPSKRGVGEQYSFYIGKAETFRNRQRVHFRGQEKKGIDDNSMLHRAVRADRTAIPDQDPDGIEADSRINDHFSWGRLITLPHGLTKQSRNKINSKLEQAAIKKYHTWRYDKDYDGVSFNTLPGGEGGGKIKKLTPEMCDKLRDLLRQGFDDQTQEILDYPEIANKLNIDRTTVSTFDRAERIRTQEEREIARSKNMGGTRTKCVVKKKSDPEFQYQCKSLVMAAKYLADQLDVPDLAQQIYNNLRSINAKHDFGDYYVVK